MKEADEGHKSVAIRVDVSASDWDSLIAEFDDAAQDASYAFRSSVWGDSRISRIAVLWQGRIVGLALAVVMLVPPFGRGVAHIRSGPIWRRKDEPVNPAALDVVLGAISDYYVRQRRLCLKILPPVDPRYSDDYVSRLSDLGYRQRELPDDNRYLVNAAIGPEQQLASLGQKWRYNLRKSLKTELEIGIESGAAAIETFDQLFREMEQRKVYQGDTWAQVCAGLRRGFPEEVRPVIVIVRLDGRPIAGAVVGHIGDTAHYIYGATANVATSINAGYAMHWWIINHLYEKGCCWYDLGGESGDQGLRQFKKGFVGRDGAVAPLPGEFTLCIDPFSGIVERSLDLVRGCKVKIRRSPLKRKLLSLIPTRAARPNR